MGWTHTLHLSPPSTISYYRWQFAPQHNSRARFQLISQYPLKLLPSRPGARTRIKFDVGSGNVGSKIWRGDEEGILVTIETFPTPPPLFHNVSFSPPFILLSKTLMIVSTLLTSNGGSTSCAKLRSHIFNFLSSTINYVQKNFIQFLEEVVLPSLCGTCVEYRTVTLTQLWQLTMICRRSDY